MINYRNSSHFRLLLTNNKNKLIYILCDSDNLKKKRIIKMLNYENLTTISGPKKTAKRGETKRRC